VSEAKEADTRNAWWRQLFIILDTRDRAAPASDAEEAAARSESWRQLVITRAARDRAALASTAAGDPRRAEIAKLISAAELAAARPTSVRRWLTGSYQDLAWLSLHEAEAQLVALLPDKELMAYARDLVAKAKALSMLQDERVKRLALAVADPPGRRLDRAEVAHLARAVNGVSDEHYAQSRGFRNRLIRLTAISFAFLGLLMIAFATNAIPLLSGKMRPSFIETAALVALFGAVGAMVSAVPPLANAAGTWNPFSLPLYQLFVKLVLGPIFALVGVMLLQSRVIPNVQFPKRLPDLLVWAIVFGASQQAVTRLVDRRAAAFLSPDPQSDRQRAR